MENEWKGLENLEIWKLAMLLGEIVYKIVKRWDYFDKRGLGQQWTDSSDSVANNIAEGYGRYFYKENRKFCYYARGSLYVSKTQCMKAYSRKLITKEEFTTVHFLKNPVFHGSGEGFFGERCVFFNPDFFGIKKKHLSPFGFLPFWLENQPLIKSVR